MDLWNVIDLIDSEDIDYMDTFRDRVYRERIDPFEHYSNQKFRKKYRFSLTLVFANKILDLIKDELPCDSRGQSVAPQVQVAIALRCWARNQIQDNSGDLHGVSQQVVSKICKNVAEALAKKSSMFINMPSTLEEENVIRKFRTIADFPQVIGAIDCTHIRVKKVAGELSEAYIDRKGYYSINVQVVCDADLKIRDVVARWRGSVHDSRIFNESFLKERFETGEFRGRLLGDSGYACTHYLFTPVLRTNSEKEEAYNRAQIRTRNTVERCFGLWKQRFRCLLKGFHTKLSTAKTTIIALAVLHNIAIDMKERIDVVRYIRRRQSLPQAARDTPRGNIARRNFIQQHF